MLICDVLGLFHWSWPCGSLPVECERQACGAAVLGTGRDVFTNRWNGQIPSDIASGARIFEGFMAPVCGLDGLGVGHNFVAFYGAGGQESVFVRRML